MARERTRTNFDKFIFVLLLRVTLHIFAVTISLGRRELWVGKQNNVEKPNYYCVVLMGVSFEFLVIRPRNSEWMSILIKSWKQYYRTLMVYNTTHNNRMGPEAQMRLIFSCSAQNHFVPSGVFLLAMLMQIHLGMEPRINSVFLLLFQFLTLLIPRITNPKKKFLVCALMRFPAIKKIMDLWISNFPRTQFPSHQTT